MERKLAGESVMLMDNSIPLGVVIDRLDKMALEVERSNSDIELEKAIDDFMDDTKSWEIIIAKPNESNIIWLQSNIEHYESVINISLKERLKLLMNDGTLYKKQAKQNYIEMYSNTFFPMTVLLSPLHKFIAEGSKEYKIYYSSVQLAKNIVQKAESTKNNSIAIYEKPYGVVAINRLTGYVEKLEKSCNISVGGIQHTFETRRFHELLESSILEMEFNINDLMNDDLLKKHLMKDDLLEDIEYFPEELKKSRK